mgnify:CR=1 FL=1
MNIGIIVGGGERCLEGGECLISEWCGVVRGIEAAAAIITATIIGSANLKFIRINH